MHLKARKSITFASLILLPVSIASCDRASPAKTAPHCQSHAEPQAPNISADAIRRTADASTRPFYRSRSWRAGWTTQSERALRQALADRAKHGLDHIEFLPTLPQQSDKAARDVALTKAALAYAVALARGEADPHDLHKVYTLPGNKPDLASGLSKALDAGELPKWLNGLAPQSGDYRTLSHAYLAAQKQAGKISEKAIADGSSLHLGDKDPHVPAIAERLTQLGYFHEQSAGGAEPHAYSPALGDAVKRLQADFGLTPDGVIGADTRDALNFSAADRARALAVALERLRWLDRDPDGTRIDVNIAAAQLTYYRSGKMVDRRRTVVGEPEKPTPQLEAKLFRLVANPTWTVPKSIQNGELAGVSAAYLRKRHMVHKGGWIVQQSGPDNSLGIVKFDLDDDQAIYLHDTDARQLLDKHGRYFSHGCVRVQDAPDFAKQLAKDEGVSDEWRKASEKKDETFVKLPNSITVRLFYHDVFVRDGKPVFRLDPYAWDDDVAQKIGFGRGGRKRAAVHAADMGP